MAIQPLFIKIILHELTHKCVYLFMFCSKADQAFTVLSMDIHGYHVLLQGRPSLIYGYSWLCTDIHGYSLMTMDIHATTLDFLDGHGQ